MRFISFSLMIWALMVLPMQAQTQRGFNGTFQAVVDGMPCKLVTKTNRNAISGTYDEGGLSLRVIGTFYAKTANGDLKDIASGAVVATFKAVLINDSLLNLTFSIGGQQRSHAFLREGTMTVASVNKNKVAPGAHDYKLVGSWSHQIITSSGGAGLQTVFYLYINANGQYAEYSRVIGGSSEWSYDSGPGELQQKGLWYSNDNIFYIRPEGQLDYTAAATYSFKDGKLITQDVGGRKIWDRE